MTPLTPKQQKRALELLELAADDLHQEIYAAGADEVEQHPTLQSHQQTFKKIVRFLEARGRIKPGRFARLP
jgi:hypothetical protein